MAQGGSQEDGEGFSVIILGAGAAGLTAAATLRKALPAAKVKILEARGRLGGRIHTIQEPMLPMTK